LAYHVVNGHEGNLVVNKLKLAAESAYRNPSDIAEIRRWFKLNRGAELHDIGLPRDFSTMSPEDFWNSRPPEERERYTREWLEEGEAVKRWIPSAERLPPVGAIIEFKDKFDRVYLAEVVPARTRRYENVFDLIHLRLLDDRDYNAEVPPSRVMRSWRPKPI
jgi:hypothetical protein